ncbi:hypothetical protein EUTSA_v10022395mg, partial [Eutrema salsugineum]
SCVLLVKTGLQGWQKIWTKIFQDIEGLAVSTSVVPNSMLVNLHGEVDVTLMYLHGKVDPLVFIKKLYKARTCTMLYRMDYGYEENPEGTRKPNNHFMRYRFELNTLEEGWDKRIIGALKTIQGVSFTIDAPTEMVYLCGNIEIGVLMKMLVKTGIHLLTMDYGVEYKDPNLKPPPNKLEAPANETETQPTQDTLPPPPPPPEAVSTSTKQQAKYKKPGGFRRFCWFLF